MKCLFSVAVAAAWFAVATANAHPAYLTAADITIEADGSFHGQARFDTLAFALNDTSARIGNEPMEALLSGPREELETQLAEARDRFQHGFRVVTDAGDATLDNLTFPDAEKVIAWRDHQQPVLPVVIPVLVSGQLPPHARTVAVRFPPVLEQVVLTIQRPDEEPNAEAVQPGAVSAALPLRLGAIPPPSPSKPNGNEAKASTELPRHKSGLLISLLTLAALSLLSIFSWQRRGSA